MTVLLEVKINSVKFAFKAKLNMFVIVLISISITFQQRNWSSEQQGRESIKLHVQVMLLFTLINNFLHVCTLNLINLLFLPC